MFERDTLLLFARIARQMMVAYENGGFASGSVRYLSAFAARSKQKSTKRSFTWDIFTIFLRFKDGYM